VYGKKLHPNLPPPQPHCLPFDYDYRGKKKNSAHRESKKESKIEEEEKKMCTDRLPVDFPEFNLLKQRATSA